VRDETSFNFIAEYFPVGDKLAVRGPIEQMGRTTDHACRLIFQKYPNIRKLLNDRTGRTIKKREGDNLITNGNTAPNTALRDALANARNPDNAATKVAAASNAPHLRPASMMKRLREVLEPLLPQLPEARPFGRKDVEELLRRYGHEDLITKQSVNNVLNAYVSEQPLKHIKRVKDGGGKMIQGQFEVLPECRSAGRKAAKKAARQAAKEATTTPLLADAAPQITFDPMAPGRNSRYADAQMRGNGAHAAEATAIPPPPEPTPASVAAPEVPAAQPAPAITAQSKADLFALLTSGFIESNEADRKEFDEAENMILAGMDKLRSVLERTRGFVTYRARVASFLVGP
jgi:hypothetical protein